MSVATADAPLQSGRRRGVWRGRIFVALLLLSMAVGFVALGTLFFDVLSKGLGLRRPGAPHESPVEQSRHRRRPPRDPRHPLPGHPSSSSSRSPIGVGTTIYLEEYADPNRWYNRLLELNIQNLAAVPSIVYGILGLAFLVRGLGLGRVLLAGALILTLLVLPTVIIAAREAIRAVPGSIREGAYALGATQWQVISRQVLPNAIPGIATGSILALARAIGETAPLILIGALTFISFNPTVMGPFTALPVQIYNWTKLPDPKFKALAAAAIIVLLIMVLLLNAAAIWLRNRYQKRW